MKKEWLPALKPFLLDAKKDEYIPSISGYKDRRLDWKCKEKSEIRLSKKAQIPMLKAMKHNLDKK
ncbi:hypothetical protein ASE74_07015 [Pedobacter sp. Leaf216]|uniref:hypothetical protein n=1 Tax=Pedobacter sp. Leaf216 TaxID=1735684 RepID=UPI0006F8CEFE|nr:hypothetical protein [Pedobacter sp. Leaf216]KQM67207.1 hypothetical protein ASE74_07015 [Pedobacter sp. Leaf216]